MTLQLIKLFVLEIDGGLSRRLESHTRRRRAAEAEAARLLELETKTEVGTRLSTRCHQNRNQTHRRKGQRNLVLFFIGRH